MRTKLEGHFIQNQNILQIQSQRPLQQRISGRRSTSSCQQNLVLSVCYHFSIMQVGRCWSHRGLSQDARKLLRPSNVEQDQIFCMKQLSGFLPEAVKVNLCCNGDSRILQIPNSQCICQGKLWNRMELGKEKCPK